MKLLLILALLLFGVWLWRSKRTARPELKRQKSQTPQAPLEMVSCPLCSVHVSREDAVQGGKGFYCSLDHRQRAEP